MLIHADMTKRAVSFAGEARWVALPMGSSGGCWSARVRSRGQRGRFPRHEHALGEEFLVLEGTFADELGEYPAGSYVRNPPGSGHAP